MDRTQQLLTRLDEIGQSLAGTGNALALLGLGSVGLETDRLDGYSDLDFFAIVKPGFKSAFIENLGWMSSICPVSYAFRNTADGYKLLFEDGIFCEFAVFEPLELAEIAFAEGRIVWRADEFDVSLCTPARKPGGAPRPVEWVVGEALTNLYVGLCRYRRGEKLSAARFVQWFAVDRVVELSGLVETEQPAYKDEFTADRRYEQRFPSLAQEMPRFVQGYERTPESALAILEFLEAHFEVNPAMREMIEELCGG